MEIEEAQIAKRYDGIMVEVVDTMKMRFAEVFYGSWSNTMHVIRLIYLNIQGVDMESKTLKIIFGRLLLLNRERCTTNSGYKIALLY